MLQAYGFGVKLETAFEKLFKFSVQGAGQLFDRVIGQSFHLPDDASDQRQKIMPQPSRQAELIELVLKLFADFAQIAAAVGRTGIGEHQVTNRKRCTEATNEAKLRVYSDKNPKFCFASLK